MIKPKSFALTIYIEYTPILLVMYAREKHHAGNHIELDS